MDLKGCNTLQLHIDTPQSRVRGGGQVETYAAWAKAVEEVYNLAVERGLRVDLSGGNDEGGCTDPDCCGEVHGGIWIADNWRRA